MIVGPHENIGRLPRWLRRLAEGGDVLAPGPPEAPMQLIDARDLAAWMLDMAETARGGAFNAIAEPGSATWGELLEAARAVTGGAREPALGRPGVDRGARRGAVGELPLWPIPSLPGLYGMSGARAAAAGLAPRRCGRDRGRHLGLAGRRRHARAAGAARCGRAGSPARPSCGLLAALRS